MFVTAPRVAGAVLGERSIITWQARHLPCTLLPALSGWKKDDEHSKLRTSMTCRAWLANCEPAKTSILAINFALNFGPPAARTIAHTKRTQEASAVHVLYALGVLPMEPCLNCLRACTQTTIFMFTWLAIVRVFFCGQDVCSLCRYQLQVSLPGLWIAGGRKGRIFFWQHGLPQIMASRQPIRQPQALPALSLINFCKNLKTSGGYIQLWVGRIKGRHIIYHIISKHIKSYHIYDMYIWYIYIYMIYMWYIYIFIIYIYHIFLYHTHIYDIYLYIMHDIYDIYLYHTYIHINIYHTYIYIYDIYIYISYIYIHITYIYIYAYVPYMYNIYIYTYIHTYIHIFLWYFMDGNDGGTKTAHLFSQQQNGKTTNKIEDGRAGIRTHQRSMTTWDVALGETWSQGRYGPRYFFGACVVKVSILLAMNAHNPLPKLTKKINNWAMSYGQWVHMSDYLCTHMYP